MGDLIFDAKGLATEWDQSGSIRERLRSGQPLVVPPKCKGVDATIPECNENADLLAPALQRLFVSKLKLPDISGLRSEIEEVYAMNNRDQPQEDEIDDAAWDTRKMLRFVKRKANRDDPSLDTQLVYENSGVFGG